MSKSLHETPVFVLTSDQDWAPSWASQSFLSLIEKHHVPTHFFRTNPCPVLDSAARDGRITQGWHPNFLPGSSHGCDIDSVIDYMRQTFPGATTVRSHAFAESTLAWNALFKAGIVADSQLPTLFQSGLEPIVHSSGIIRFPVFFEDDVFFDWDAESLNLAPVLSRLFTPGLKVFNFHATFVACNMPSREFYQEIKADIFSTTLQNAAHVWNGKGTRVVFEHLLEAIFKNGYGFTPFLDLVEQTRVMADHRS